MPVAPYNLQEIPRQALPVRVKFSDITGDIMGRLVREVPTMQDADDVVPPNSQVKCEILQVRARDDSEPPLALQTFGE